MKLRKFITISCLCICGLQAYGCGPWNFETRSYRLFRLTPANETWELFSETEDYYTKRHSDLDNQNITEWQRLIGSNVKSSDIYEVVYRYSVSDMERVGNLLGKSKSKDTLLRNSFVQRMVSNGDRQMIEYLRFAKVCEHYRSISADDWEYPSAEDLTEQGEMLNQVIDKALSMKQSRFADRYLFQALRAAFTLRDWDVCLNLWEGYFRDMKPCYIRTLSEDYIGGVYFRTGDYLSALTHFASADLYSQNYEFCLYKINADFTLNEALTAIYKHNCNSPALQYLLQRYGSELEANTEWNAWDEPCYLCAIKKSFHSLDLKKQQQYADLRNFCLKAVKDEQVTNPAMWQYSAAFFALMQGDLNSAMREAKAGQDMQASEDLSDKLHILYLIANALNGEYDEQYEESLLQDLKWFEQKIKTHLPKDFSKDGYIASSFGNLSVYYYNDMLRKYLLGLVVPKCIAAGEKQKAMLLTGFTSELIANVSGYRKHSQEYNQDFSTDIFVMMDTMPVEDVLEYVSTIYNNNSEPLIKFLASYCLKNKDYYNEIIGTKLMREERYNEAVTYFEKVQKSYWKTLNVYPYFTYPCFDDKALIRRKKAAPAWDYKLAFAKEMSRLKSQFIPMQDCEDKAALLYRYSLGLIAVQQSFALTKYGKDCYLCYSIYQENDSVTAERIYGLLKEVKTMTEDRDMQAKCLVAQMKTANNSFYAYRWDSDFNSSQNASTQSTYGMLAYEFETEFADTRIFKEVEAKCDTYKLYKKTPEENE
ncbi:MAG: hypothetical protein LBR17_00875 [Bacteroidales bacterium]|jgi:hypothetical protein|nr:hypothetical protein [Bacteroidales bacterium]